MPEATPFTDILQQCIAGDSKAQRLLFNKFKDLLYRLAYKTLGPGFDVDDVVQRIFIEVFRSLPSFRGSSAFDTWVYRVGLNVCTSELRTRLKKRQIKVVRDDGIIGMTAKDLQPGPLSLLEQKELEAVIYGALDKLDAKKRLVVVLCDIEQKSLNEAAEIVQKPVGTVKSRLFHGREELKKMLAKYLKA